ncbi:DUF2914 domain-containing protein [Candidatus Parcubacteria bacterium]|nr:DUF2914 domain-containing protein [Candidatus Parcubacteria bacterium]
MPVAIVHKVTRWYERYERSLSSASLVGGFVFDALTLQRVDEFWENFWVVIHLLVVAVAIILINRIETGEAEPAGSKKRHFWLINILQFFFGGLLSTFIVFYFRSATLVASWPFLLVLVLAFVANERLKQHYARLSFQVSLLFLSLFLFDIFLVPVLLHSIGPMIFIVSGVVSLGVFGVFMMLLKRLSGERFRSSKKFIFIAVGSIFFLINALYFTNLIPPIPISLAEAGIYHSISKDALGNYILTGEERSWRDYFKLVEDVRLRDSEPLYAYTAIFSPAKFSTKVVHEWQRFDEASDKWITTSTVPLSIVGGRGEGYRTYSISGVVPGRWRVNVKTLKGELIGRINFNAKAI